TPVLVLGAGDAIGRDLTARGMTDAIVFGPDEESAELINAVTQDRPLTGCVATKRRFGDRDVCIEIPKNINLKNRSIVIVDDIVSSGGTLVTLATALGEAGVSSVTAYVVHALFDEGAAASMRSAGIGDVRSLDCIPHATNSISVVDLIARMLGCY